MDPAESQCALSASRRCDEKYPFQTAIDLVSSLNAHLAQAGVATAWQRLLLACSVWAVSMRT